MDTDLRTMAGQKAPVFATEFAPVNCRHGRVRDHIIRRTEPAAATA